MFVTEIERTSHVKAYIHNKYPMMDVKKFDVVKIGARIYLYAINREGNLERAMIFQGNLPMINELSVLKKAFEKNVENAIKKLGFYS